MLDTNGAVFEFKTEADDRFAQDYHRLIDSNIPLFAVKEDFLFLMETQGITYFKMPSSITRDHKDHNFYFEVETFETSRVKKYKYLKHD
mgnify:CR=1 FL=1